MNKQQKVILAVIAGSLLGLFIIGNLAVDYIANVVIKKLTKEYSPSPYGPGVNPDKIDVNVLHRMQQQPKMTSTGTGEASYNWNQEWDKSRN